MTTIGIARRIGLSSAIVGLALTSVPGESFAGLGRWAQTPKGSVERLGKDQLRLGQIRIDLATNEVRVPARINPVTTIEFFANKRGGTKAYESALTLDTDGVTFNTALMLLGLERPQLKPGDLAATVAAVTAANRVDIWVEIAGPPPQKVRAERLIFDRITNREVPESTWVYTGSAIADGRYLADVDGTLIGFMHRTDPVIERIDAVGIGRYGEIILNPTLGLKADTPVTVLIKTNLEAPPKK